MSLTWPQALAWRLRRHLLDPVGSKSVADVVNRLGVVPANSEVGAELAICVRRERSRLGDVARALASGRIIKTYAFRGATHLMTPEEGGIYLALRAASRMWELPSWQRYYGLLPSDWPGFRTCVREVLAEGPLTRSELATAIARRRRFRRAGAAFSATLLKALAWQGDICFGAVRDGQATIQRLDHVPRWAGLPDLEEAGTRAVVAYFRSYGPAAPSRVHYWLAEGLGAGRRRIQSWIEALGNQIATIEIEGESTLVLREDVEDLRTTSASEAVRLLPGYDPWILGPGTADVRVVPAAKRSLLSRGANLVIAGGAVAGTWSVKADEVAVDWFGKARMPPWDDLAAQVARLARILGRSLQLTRP